MGKKSKFFMVLWLTMSLWLLFASPHMSYAQQGLIVLEHTQELKKVQRPPVNFYHDRHIEIYTNCTECHHIYKYQDGKRVNIWKGEAHSCAFCHKEERDGQVMSLRDAFHENCNQCHLAKAKETNISYRVACGDCHIRREKLRPPHQVPANVGQACSDCHVQTKFK